MLVALPYGLGDVVTPVDRCPRCKTAMLDARLDASANATVLDWAKYKESEGPNSCLALILSIVTLGLWLVVYGGWSLLAIGPRAAQKKAARAAAPAAIRYHCRNCNLDFYEREVASFAS